MTRAPCCDKGEVRKGPWTAEEDELLVRCMQQHGDGHWSSVPRKAGLNRCGKSCRLRWANYLRPNLKRGTFTAEEEQLIIRLHREIGNRWAKIATELPGRTDNDIKNHWNTRIKKKLREEGIDPDTHLPLAPTQAPDGPGPQGTVVAAAAGAASSAAADSAGPMAASAASTAAAASSAAAPAGSCSVAAVAGQQQEKSNGDLVDGSSLKRSYSSFAPCEAMDEASLAATAKRPAAGIARPSFTRLQRAPGMGTFLEGRAAGSPATATSSTGGAAAVKTERVSESLSSSSDQLLRSSTSSSDQLLRIPSDEEIVRTLGLAMEAYLHRASSTSSSSSSSPSSPSASNPNRCMDGDASALAASGATAAAAICSPSGVLLKRNKSGGRQQQQQPLLRAPLLLGGVPAAQISQSQLHLQSRTGFTMKFPASTQQQQQQQGAFTFSPSRLARRPPALKIPSWNDDGGEESLEDVSDGGTGNLPVKQQSQQQQEQQQQHQGSSIFSPFVQKSDVWGNEKEGPSASGGFWSDVDIEATLLALPSPCFITPPTPLGGNTSPSFDAEQNLFVESRQGQQHQILTESEGNSRVRAVKMEPTSSTDAITGCEVTAPSLAVSDLTAFDDRPPTELPSRDHRGGPHDEDGCGLLGDSPGFPGFPSFPGSATAHSSSAIVSATTPGSAAASIFGGMMTPGALQGSRSLNAAGMLFSPCTARAISRFASCDTPSMHPLPAATAATGGSTGPSEELMLLMPPPVSPCAYLNPPAIVDSATMGLTSGSVSGAVGGQQQHSGAIRSCTLASPLDWSKFEPLATVGF